MKVIMSVGLIDIWEPDGQTDIRTRPIAEARVQFTDNVKVLGVTLD